MDIASRVSAKLRELPEEPGVYQMKGRGGRILYIGKALSLRARVCSYFQSGAENDPRIRHLVRRIEDVEWIVVPTEVDALMLESSLIRQFKPQYNTHLKDDKSYPYIKITVGEPYPRVLMTRRYEHDGAKYWGPLTSVRQVRSAVRFIAGMFQLRTCTLELDGAKFVHKPCLDYHLKLCSAPCVNYISREEYRKLVNYAVAFFNGHYGRVLDELKRRMRDAAEGREYETAARYRDLIAAAERSFDRTRVIGRPELNMDVIGVARSKDRACVLVMPVRDGRLLGERKYLLSHRMEEDDDVLAGFLKLHYANPLNVPAELVLPWEPAECEVLQQWLSGLRRQVEADFPPLGVTDAGGTDDGVIPTCRAATPGGQFGADDRAAPCGHHEAGSDAPPTAEEAGKSAGPTKSGGVKFTVPKSGAKREVLDIAQRNAQERLHTDLLVDPEGDDFVITEGQRALQAHLGLTDPPRRIEGFDIANLQGGQAAGAMVVNIGGRKAPREYRLFNIRLKTTPDDFAMLRETLVRRLRRLAGGEAKWDCEVDVVMIDGGKGQLSSAKAALEQVLGEREWSAEMRQRLERIKLCSLAKQEELVYHYLPDGTVEELRLARTDPGLRLLVGLRNEAHRYGNLQHQKLRDKAVRLSVLDTIPGVGESRRRGLLQYFGSVKGLREASVEELARAPGITPKLAEQVRRYLDRDAKLETGKAEIKREMKIRRVRRPGQGQ